MFIGERLRIIRESRHLSRGDLGRSIGLPAAFIEGIEDGLSLPDLNLLEHLARELQVPLQQLFHDGEETPPLQNLHGRLTADEIAKNRLTAA